MPDRTASFDAEAFYEALNAQRAAKKMTWRQVAVATGVSASTFTRMAQGKRPDVDSLAALCSWSGLSADDFVRSDSKVKEPEPLAMISTLLRADRNLSRQNAAMLDDLIKVTYQRLKKAR
jgi:transcriptional regulator with XRE-family HTH domain